MSGDTTQDPSESLRSLVLRLPPPLAISVGIPPPERKVKPSRKPKRWPWEFDQWRANLHQRIIEIIYEKLPQGAQIDVVIGTQHRDHGCEHYSICLTEAAVAKWKSFTCRYCPLSSIEEPCMIAAARKEYHARYFLGKGD